MIAAVAFVRRGCQGWKTFPHIAEYVEGESLATLVVNKLRGTLKCDAVNAPVEGGIFIEISNIFG